MKGDDRAYAFAHALADALSLRQFADREFAREGKRRNRKVPEHLGERLRLLAGGRLVRVEQDDDGRDAFFRDLAGVKRKPVRARADEDRDVLAVQSRQPFDRLPSALTFPCLARHGNPSLLICAFRQHGTPPAQKE